MNVAFEIRWATVADVPAVLAMIKELAEYENASDQVTLTEDQLRADGFDEKRFEILVAETDSEVVGIAFFYPRYSTWKGHTLYLEDLIVKEEQRRKGIGCALFEELLRISKERKCARLEWQVLDWNEPAIAFYEKMEANIDGEWLNCKMEF
jgi:predicted N-acetyltransferase YhbS